MDLLSTDIVRVTRRDSAPSFVDGYPVDGTPVTTFNIKASVQPAPATVLQMLSEGDRSRDPKYIYTRTALLLNDIVTLTTGTQYEVVEVADWNKSALAAAHYRALALKVTR